MNLKHLCEENNVVGAQFIDYEPTRKKNNIRD